MRLFLSYSHKDDDAKSALLELLDEYLCLGPTCDIWQDLAILPGAHWDAEIKKALATSDIGLLLVSPAFLGSRYITDTELPALLAKRVIPVALEKVRFDGTMNLRGLESTQLFYDAKGRAFGQLRTRRDRREFADQLHQKIVAIGKAHAL